MRGGYTRVDLRQAFRAKPKTSGFGLVSCFKSPMEKSETIYLRSDLAVEECLRRIRETTDAPKLQFFFPFGYGGSKPVFAKLRGNRIKLWKRKEGRNDFAPCFFGVFSSEGLGSRLVGRFRMDRAVRLLIAYWLIFTVGITLVTLPELLDHLTNPKQGQLSGFDFMPLGLVIFGILLFKYGRRIGKPEEALLLDFLRTTLEARQEDSRFLGLHGIGENSPL